MGKHLRFYFTVGIEEMLEYDVDGILDGIGAAVMQGSDVLCANGCDYLMS